MTLTVTCMDCRESIQAESNEALAQIIIAHYAENHYDQYLELPKSRDTRGTPEVLKDRSVTTRPTPVRDE